MQFKPPDYVLQALKLLHAKGFEAFLVGGCVRDAILQKVPEDYDIATQATPEEMRAAFFPYKTIDTGVKHGTLTLLVEGHPLQVTTYRREGAYSDGRHPDHVIFTGALLEDLKRRDFTINAMAWNPESGLYDPLHGQEDCERRLLRAVGNPQQRFLEDALRILRAFRFACALGFEIEADTLRAMELETDGLQRVSAERIAQELNRSLVSPFFVGALAAYPQVLLMALPELASSMRAPLCSNDSWQHTLRVLENTPPDLALRWAALFLGLNKPEIAGNGTCSSARVMSEVMNRLKQPRALKEEAVNLVLHQGEEITKENLPLQLSERGIPFTLKLLGLRLADAAAQASPDAGETARLETLIKQAEEIAKVCICLRIKDMVVKGDDLLDMGYKQDKSLGETLNRLLEMVLKGELQNNREALLKQASEWLEESL